MLERCPFYPNKPNPCSLPDCKFLCNGGCAIQLSAYAYDAHREAKEITKKLRIIGDELDDIRRKISR